MSQTQSISIKPLSPYTVEFETKGKKNRIDYYFLSGNYNLNEDFYKKIRKELVSLYPPNENYHFFSIYIYKRTNELNEKFNKSREWLDGNDSDLVAYVRYSENNLDIFYIIENGKVIYDIVENKKVNFDYE